VNDIVNVTRADGSPLESSSNSGVGEEYWK
jgi:hypothetical protein